MNRHIVRSSLLLALALFTLLPRLFSQQINHNTPATDVQLRAWLDSNDPRLQAWAVTLARERKQSALLALLPDWLKQSLIRDNGTSPGPEESRVYDAVLDALIRGGSQTVVEPSTLSNLSGHYPAQAFLLLERLPAQQQLSLLKEWFSGADVDQMHSALARLAAMRLAQWPSPVPGFAARLISTAQEQFTIDLGPKGDDGSAIEPRGCWDSLYRSPQAGWPVVYVPLVEEGPPYSETNISLVALDDDRVSYRWVEENSPGGSCASIQGLDQRARHEIVAYWLKQSQQEMKWQLTKSVSIRWTNRASFDSSLGRLIEREEENFASMANDLAREGLLSKEEATWARPKLIVQVVCHIDPCPVRGASKDLPPENWQPFF